MPLQYDDIPGSWGVYSKDWPKITFDSQKEIDEIRRLIVERNLIPYGSYVTVDTELRLETQEYVDLILKRISQQRLTFDMLRQANVARVPTFRNARGELSHDGHHNEWTLNDWFTAVTGELGEAGNILKKVRRGDMTLDEARSILAKELADVQTYLDILAHFADIDLGEATIAKFNEVSERVGSPVRIG